MKIALPATLAAIPLVGGHAAGIAAFGGALGVPVLLLIFLGTAGITSIIEAAVTNPEARRRRVACASISSAGSALTSSPYAARHLTAGPSCEVKKGTPPRRKYRDATPSGRRS